MAKIEFKYAILDNEDTCGLLDEDYSTEVKAPEKSLEDRIRLAICNMAGIRLKYMETGRCLGVYKSDLERILKSYEAVRDEYFELSAQLMAINNPSVKKEDHIRVISQRLTDLENWLQAKLDKIKLIDKDLWFYYQEDVEDVYRGYAKINDGASFDGVRRRKKLPLKEQMMGRKLNLK
ncbi:MAG: hypothetical protein IJ400_04640 [Clostridia bacterium]|nr:hypothetical protein [Clostridia bacterium]